MIKKNILVLIVILFLFGCSDKVIEDTNSTQKPETLFVRTEIPENMMIFDYYADAMNRDATFPLSVVVDKQYYTNNPIQRGDIVFLEWSDEFIQKHMKTDNKEELERVSRYHLSRVIGLSGEEVSISKGQIYINKIKLDTFYGRQTYHDKVVKGKEVFSMSSPVTVKGDELFIMADEWWRTTAINSSEFGAIKRELVKGKVVGYVNDDK